MAKFRYHALNSEQQPVKGELAAESVQQAIADLEAKGLTVQSIGYATPGAAQLGEDEQSAMRSLHSRLLADGAAIAPALEAYAEEIPSRRRRGELQTLARVLERGDRAEAERTFATLPEYWIPLLSAATPSRDPARVLQGFLEESHQADELRRQWWLALAYPLVVAGLAAAVLITISILIVPGFREIFLDFDLQLPGITLLVLKFSDWISNGLNMIFAVSLLAIVALVIYASRFSTRGWFGNPFRVPFARTTEIAKLARFTADLLEAGLPLPDALRIAGTSTSRRRLRRAATQVAREIESGGETDEDTYSRPLTAAVSYALRAAMPPSSRIRLLKEISQAHAERSHARLSWTRGIVEPVAIVAIGILVGFIVIALFLPLIKLVEGLSM